MSDTPQGPGWWQASDGKWYAPQQQPGVNPGYGQPTPAPGQPVSYQGAPPQYGAPAGYQPYGAPGMAGPGAYATFWQRLGAIAIDAIVPGIAFYILFFIAAAISNTLGAIVGLLGFLGLLGFQIWNLVQQGTTGQTIGKKQMKIRLISEQTGQPVGVGLSIGRQFVHAVDSLACYIGWLFPLWDPKRQTFADKILNTVVVPA